MLATKSRKKPKEIGHTFYQHRGSRENPGPANRDSGRGAGGDTQRRGTAMGLGFRRSPSHGQATAEELEAFDKCNERNSRG